MIWCVQCFELCDASCRIKACSSMLIDCLNLRSYQATSGKSCCCEWRCASWLTIGSSNFMWCGCRCKCRQKLANISTLSGALSVHLSVFVLVSVSHSTNIQKINWLVVADKRCCIKSLCLQRQAEVQFVLGLKLATDERYYWSWQLNMYSMLVCKIAIWGLAVLWIGSGKLCVLMQLQLCLFSSSPCICWAAAEPSVCFVFRLGTYSLLRV